MGTVVIIGWARWRNGVFAYVCSMIFTLLIFTFFSFFSNAIAINHYKNEKKSIKEVFK